MVAPCDRLESFDVAGSQRVSGGAELDRILQVCAGSARRALRPLQRRRAADDERQAAGDGRAACLEEEPAGEAPEMILEGAHQVGTGEPAEITDGVNESDPARGRASSQE